jgi:hypothetical protein
MSRNERDEFEPLATPQAPAADDITQLLNEAFQWMNTPGEEGEREYARIIRQLREVARDATSTADRWIQSAPGDPMLRWSLLHVLASIQDEACLETLRSQLTRELPQRIQAEDMCEQPADYEEMASVMAIDGLGLLAEESNLDAIDILLDTVANQERRSLRQAAVAALLRAADAARAH